MARMNRYVGSVKWCRVLARRVRVGFWIWVNASRVAVLIVISKQGEVFLKDCWLYIL